MLVVVVPVVVVVIVVIVVVVSVMVVLVVVVDVSVLAIIVVVVSGVVVGAYSAGRRTASIMWTTPFEAFTSTVSKLATTDPSELVICHCMFRFLIALIVNPGLAVLMGRPSCKSVDMSALPVTTCERRTLFNSLGLVATASRMLAGRRSNATVVGAKTV